MTATIYAQLTKEVDLLIHRYSNAVEPDVAAYMIMRASLLNVGTRRGSEDVSSLAYRLADEFATAGVR